jgi:hypothetical protein
MTSGTVHEELREFAARVLEQSGGLVEWPGTSDEGTALVPPDLASRAHLPGETFALCEQPREGALCVSLASDFLDVAGGLLEVVVPRVGTFRTGERYLRVADVAEGIARAFQWRNARVLIEDASPSAEAYDTWTIHASLRSEDCWETCVSVTLNARTGVEVDIGDPLRLLDLEEAPGLKADVFGTFDAAVQAALRRVLASGGAFLGRMDQRRERDQRRLRDYYGALLKESKKPNRRTKTPPSPEELKDKQRAVDLELRRKLGELDERYRVEAVLRGVAVVRTLVPVLVVKLNVWRKQARRTHVTFWNSLLKQYEPLACTGCGRGIYSVSFSNDDVLPWCPPCFENRGKQASAKPR